MTDDKTRQLRDNLSALKVQRDSAHRELTRLDTENRLLRKHQQEIRAWLAEAIDAFAAARSTDQVLEVADEIHRKAVERLGATQALVEP